MRLAASLHDLALSLIAGGIAGTALCAWILFDRSPEREVAGQIGAGIFGALGPAVLILSLILIAARMVLQRAEPGGPSRTLSLHLAAGIAVLSAIAALWLTPRMLAIWSEAPHAQDGSGLMGEARAEFFMLHGLGNIAYLAVAAMAAVMIVLRSRR
jgi:hypothetical protein